MTKRDSARLVVLIILFWVFSSAPTQAQIGLGGYDAIMMVPTAKLQEVNTVAVGVGYIPQPYAVFLGPDHDNLRYFATFGFLPFLEISFRATKALKRKEGSIGDRMASFRLQILRETPTRPAVTLGLHDASALFRRKEWFHSLYGVATKSIFVMRHWNLETTVGYGVDWIETRVHEFVGLFGGVTWGYQKIISLKAEYDTDHFNYGLGFNLFGVVAGNVVVIDGKKLAFGLNLIRTL